MKVADNRGVLRTRTRPILAVLLTVVAIGCSQIGLVSSPAPRSAPAVESVVPTNGGPTGPTEEGRVTRVVDGDTIRVDIDGTEYRVRYIGMDTPESVFPGRPVEPYALAASEANERLVAGRDVILEKDVSETDRFDRLLRYVWVRDGDRWTMVNEALVLLGFAQVATYPPDVKYVDRFLAAQRDAREAERGLWGSE